MAKITARLECNKNGLFINLGIGMPTKVADYIEKSVLLQSENGLLGIGKKAILDSEKDPDLVNAGKEAIKIVPGASFFDSADSFSMIRAGKIDLTILGGMEVSQEGDLANWAIPGKKITGMGGAMDLVAGVKRVVVLMQYFNKNNQSKLVKTCSLPLTGKGIVDRLITDIGVFDFCNNVVILKAKPEKMSIRDIESAVPFPIQIDL
ncbi:MAG: 3-oxoacid CoA-transferase subunit B [Rickettsiales bacterium]